MCSPEDREAEDRISESIMKAKSRTTIRRNVGIPAEKPSRGRKRLYKFGELDVEDALDCYATYRTIHCSVGRYKKKNPGTDFCIEVMSSDPWRVRVVRIA